MSKDSDEWETPQELFNKLNQKYDFQLDVCCSYSNCKTIMNPHTMFYLYYNYLVDDLTRVMKNHWVFMNPPYSKPYTYIKKAFKESKYVPIVCLLKCDPSTKWWGIFYDYEKQQPKPGVKIEYFSKRLKFERNGIPSSSANFPSCLIIMDRRNKGV